MLNSLHEKLNTFQQWETKLRKSKVMEEEKKRYREQKLHKSSDPISKQIPVTDDDEELYPRRKTDLITKIAVKIIIHPKTTCIQDQQVALQEETIGDHKYLRIHLEHRHSTKALYLSGRRIYISIFVKKYYININVSSYKLCLSYY